MNLLLVDNYDSYTFNIYQLLAERLERPPTVIRNNEFEYSALQLDQFDGIVISPGPGSPDSAEDFGICRELITNATVPLLGVCLGHQGIAHAFGGVVGPAPVVMHGQISTVTFDEDPIFAGIPQLFDGVRYHSLAVQKPLPKQLRELAWDDAGVVMALRHRTRPIWGVQFHPESIATGHGPRLLENFLAITHKHAGLSAEDAGQRRAATRRPAAKKSAASSSHDHRLVVRELDALPHLETAFEKMFGDDAFAFWLDTSMADPRHARFSFMGSACVPGGRVHTYDRDTGKTMSLDPLGGGVSDQRRTIFDVLSDELEQLRVKSDLPFGLDCGFVGYLGYEVKADCGGTATHVAETPDAVFMFAPQVLVFDHRELRTYVVQFVPEGEAPDDEAIDNATATLESIPSRGSRNGHRPTVTESVAFDFARERKEYRADIASCQEHLLAGDSYEICLTNRVTADVEIDPFETYKVLRRHSPAPYSAFLKLGDVAVLSSSPERFLKLNRQGAVESKPIKGTRARGENPRDDARLVSDLKSSAKDRAENLMIVDLLRNDLGVVCDIGSVEAPVIMDVETYEHVHQLVSTVRGQLREELSPIDCVRACFPGGSMTGAPKLRTTEIIDRLETSARGVYSGALGYFGLSGSMDLSIVIRTLVATPRGVSVGTGGAITVLSDADDEYDELLTKARALMHTLDEAAALGHVRDLGSGDVERASSDAPTAAGEVADGG